MSGAPQGYARPEEGSSAFVNQASQDRQPMFAQSTWKSNERRYGSIWFGEPFFHPKFESLFPFSWALCTYEETGIYKQHPFCYEYKTYLI